MSEREETCRRLASKYIITAIALDLMYQIDRIWKKVSFIDQSAYWIRGHFPFVLRLSGVMLRN